MAQDLTLEEIQNFKGVYPKQMWYMFLVEMWERFCFYGMRGVLTIFMIDHMRGGLGLAEREANFKYGVIQALIWAFTFLGGMFADKILGFKRSLVYGALVMIAGNFIIAINPQQFFYLGITCSAIGTGFFKPNITSMVGFLYKEGDTRRDAGFSAFYSGINVGALLGGVVCVLLGKYVGWSYAFISSGTVMIISLITFLLTKKYIQPIGNKPDSANQNLRVIEVDDTLQKVEANISPVTKNAWWKEYAVYAFGIACIPVILFSIEHSDFAIPSDIKYIGGIQIANLFMAILAVVAVIYFLFITFRQKEKEAISKLFAAFVFIFFYFVFETFFEQAGGSLAIFAEKNLSHRLFGFIRLDPNMVNNSANSLFVIPLGFIAGLVWFWLSKRKAEPNTINKFGISMLFMALSFFVFYSLRYTANADGTGTSLGVFTFAYLLISISEICLSPIGMSVVTKLSPKKIQGVMIGMWFLASAYGQYGAGLLGAAMSSDTGATSDMERLLSYTNGYKQMAYICIAAGVILIAFAPLIKKLMRGVR
jgi:POT family proton-dependent oligopeptide transporter